MRPKNGAFPFLAILTALLGGVGLISWLALRQIDPDLGTKPTPSIPDSPKPPNIGQSFTDLQGIPVGLFNYGGSTTWAPIRQMVDPVLQSKHPQFRLRYTNPPTLPPGSGTGIQMLLNDQLDFAQSSRPLTEKEYQAAQQRGFSLEQIPVAIDGIAIAVHPSLTVKGLTLEQLQQIYTGKITNWQEVGGDNRPIIPYSRPLEAAGTVEFFRDNVLNGEGFREDIIYVQDTTQALRKIAQDPGGIYYASAPEIVPQCSVKPLPIGRTTDQWIAPYQEPLIPRSQCPAQRNQVNQGVFQKGDYPLTRRLFVIIKRNGQRQEKAGQAYVDLLLTEEGQQLINQAGFVNIR